MSVPDEPAAAGAGASRSMAAQHDSSFIPPRTARTQAPGVAASNTARSANILHPCQLPEGRRLPGSSPKVDPASPSRCSSPLCSPRWAWCTASRPSRRPACSMDAVVRLLHAHTGWFWLWQEAGGQSATCRLSYRAPGLPLLASRPVQPSLLLDPPVASCATAAAIVARSEGPAMMQNADSLPLNVPMQLR